MDRAGHSDIQGACLYPTFLFVPIPISKNGLPSPHLGASLLSHHETSSSGHFFFLVPAMISGYPDHMHRSTAPGLEQCSNKESVIYTSPVPLV